MADEPPDSAPFTNEVELAGYLTEDAQFRPIPNKGKDFCLLKVETHEGFFDPNTGKWKTQKDWNLILVYWFQRVAELKHAPPKAGQWVRAVGKMESKKHEGGHWKAALVVHKDKGAIEFFLKPPQRDTNDEKKQETRAMGVAPKDGGFRIE